MEPRAITGNIFAVGAIDWDRRLFDSLIPLPDGTSYNSYLLNGSQKTALLDTVDPTKEQVLLDYIKGVKKIDYLVAHHAEQDHAGSIGAVLKIHPEATVVCTEKCRRVLLDELHIDSAKFQTVKTGDKIELGELTLEFIEMPWVHWPETMVTYVPEQKFLFTCDFFGSHLAASDLYVNDAGELFDPTGRGRVYEAAKRYYAEIMMPFAPMIRKHLEALKKYDIQMILPSHGPIYRKPAFIMDAYRDWSSEKPKNVAVIPYVSMHGSTALMVERLVNALAVRGIAVERFDLTTADIGKLAMSLVDAATIVIGTPTVLVGPHPKAAYAAVLANALRPKLKFASVIGSFGWAGKTVDILAGLLGNLKVEMIPPVMIMGAPREADYAAIDRLADSIAQKHKEAGLLA